jgi:hypothetical protein
MSGKHAQNEGNTPAPEAGARPRPNTVADEAQRSAPQQGHNHVHSPENSTADEGKVKGNYDYLLNSPKISSTRHPLPADVKDFDHHFAGDKKAAKSKK